MVLDAESPTAPAAPPLTGRVLRATGWTAAAFGSSILAQLVQMIVLARAFGAAGLGLVAIVTLTSAYVDIFLTAGVGQAIVQRRGVTRGELQSLYWVNTVMAAAVALAVLGGGGALAGWSGAPAAAGMLQVLALVFLVNGHGMIPRAVLEKELRFRPLAFSDIGANAVLVATTLTLVLAGTGPVAAAWGLVAAAVTRVTVASIATRHDFRAGLHFRLSETRRFLSFGGIQMLDATLNFATANVATLTLGRFLGPAAMGGFTLVLTLAVNLPARLNPVLTRVMFPALAMIQDDSRRVARAYLRCTAAVALVNVPALLVLAVAGPEVLATFFGPELAWTAPLLVPLAAVGILRALGNPVGPLLMATDNNKLGLAINLAQTAVTIPVIVVGAYRWGTTGAAVALLVVSVVNIAVATIAVHRVVGISGGAFLRVGAGPVLLALPAVTATAVVAAVLPAWPAPLRLAVLMPVAGLALLATGLRSRSPLVRDALARFRSVETDRVAVLPPVDEVFDGSGGAIALWITQAYRHSALEWLLFTPRTRHTPVAGLARFPVAQRLLGGLFWVARAGGRVTGWPPWWVYRQLLGDGYAWIWLIAPRVGRCGIVHVHNQPRYAVWLRRCGYRGRIVVHMHNDLAVTMRPDRFAEVAEAVDAWVFCSAHLAAEARRGFGIEGSVLANGVALPQDGGSSGARRPARVPGRLVYAGRVIPEKGALEAVDVCAAMRAAGSPATLSLIGGAGIGAAAERTAYYTSVERRAAEVNAEHGPDVVRMLGFVGDRERLFEELATAVAFVYPCRWDEPFGMVLVEAMAAGTPVLAPARGGIPEVVTDGVTGVLVNDRVAMLRALELLADPVRWERMSAAARDDARDRFAWPGIARRLDELLPHPRTDKAGPRRP